MVEIQFSTQGEMSMRVIMIGAAALSFISTTAIAARCADYLTCRDAVIAWCAGKHPRADGDGDGIPCENVCRSLAEVEKIKKEIGCQK